jgi:hypothetical protein
MIYFRKIKFSTVKTDKEQVREDRHDFQESMPQTGRRRKMNHFELI